MVVMLGKFARCRTSVLGEVLLISSFFFSRFLTHGQLISSVMTRFDTWLIMRESTLLVLTSWCSANIGTSRNACATGTLVSVYVASTKVALTLQGLILAKSRGKGSSGLQYVG